MKLKTLFILAFGSILALSFLSCSRQEESMNSENGKTVTSEMTPHVDTSDLIEVAHAAWKAIVDEDYDAYIIFVLPDSRQRESREQWLSSARKMKKAPGFKENTKFNIQKVDDPNRAAAVSEDMRVFLGMVYKDGRWWMD